MKPVNDREDGPLLNRPPLREQIRAIVREWLMDRGFQGKEGQVMPELDDEFRVQVSRRYIELYETVSGREFQPDAHPDPEARCRQALMAYGPLEEGA